VLRALDANILANEICTQRLSNSFRFRVDLKLLVNPPYMERDRMDGYPDLARGCLVWLGLLDALWLKRIPQFVQEALLA